MSEPTPPSNAPVPEGLTPPAPGAASQNPPLPPYATPQPPAGAAPYQAPAYPPPAYGAPGQAGAQPPAAGYPAGAYPPAAGYGAPAGYAPPSYGAPVGYAAPYGYATVRTNPLAVTSMVASLVGFVLAWTWVLALGLIVGVITGHIALGQIARTKEKGRGMALAGVIVGWIGIGFGVLLLIVIGLFVTTSPSSF